MRKEISNGKTYHHHQPRVWQRRQNHRQAIQCYDAELIQKLAVESGFDEPIKEAGEYTPRFPASAFTDRSFGLTNEDLLWKLQYRIIRELAEKEPCVIVGRCADFILQDRTDCLKVFVHADMKFRADRIVRVYGEREKKARLKEKDKRRAAYYRSIPI